MWNDHENKVIFYAELVSLSSVKVIYDYKTLEVESPFDHINVANSLKRDLLEIQSWCST